jgi:DNA-binding NtrC family response regulator
MDFAPRRGHEVNVDLLADRFRVEAGRTIDLATGAEAIVITSSAGGLSEQRRWADRCDRFATMHQPELARLLDFGRIGESRRFEAWRAAPAAAGVADQVRARVNRLLAAGGLTTTSGARVGVDGGHLVVVPDADAGYPSGSDEGPPEDLPAESCAVERIGRPAVTTIAELVSDATRLEPCAIALWGERGVGLTTALLDVARAARAHGMIPISAALDDPAVWDALDDRSLCIIDQAGDGRGWRRLVAAGFRLHRSRLLLLAAREETRHVHNVRLDRVPADRLAAAVWPPAAADRHAERIRRIASSAQGLPGQFTRQLWRAAAWSAETAVGPSMPPSSRVAEPGEPYVVTRRSTIAASPRRAWPVPADIGARRRRLDEASARLAGGRLAVADREIRAEAAALVRRDDVRPAARALLALAAAWLKRGRVDRARTAAREAGDLIKHDDDDSGLLDAALLSGQIATEAGELVEAESSLRGALAAARLGDDADRTCRCRHALARVLFWQGRFDEAVAELESIEADAASQPDLTTAVPCLRAEIAVGRREPATAVTLATAALARASTEAPGLTGQAACAAALAHLAVGDQAAVQRDVEVAVRAARRARDPLQALLARTIAAESHRRSGRHGPATALLARVARIERAHLPATTWARIDLLRLLTAGAAADEAVERLVSRSGLAGIRALAPARGDGGDGVQTTETLELLQICQTTGDEAEALARVCASLRRALRASAVGFLVPRRDEAPALAIDGRGLDPALAARVEDAGQPIRHDPPSGGPEMASPVKYAGRLTSVVAARWPVGTLVDTARAMALLAVAAAAAGPLAAAVRARLGARPPQDGIVGISQAMADVRRAIERASAAPFPVLIEGESGSGKELIARAIHRGSVRRDRAFCAVNCAALPDDLVEAELFGHARGAFTGAVADRPGVFDEANGGTLFLDEIGELSPRAQAKVLRAIQDGEVRRVGESTARRVDVRIVAATNRNLRDEAAAGRFRIDLLYRLDVVRIRVPPLRERPDDIPLLVEHVWREIGDRLRSRAVLSAATIAALGRHTWPGNVRELQNVLAALAVRCPRRGVVQPSALPSTVTPPVEDAVLTLSAARRTFEERFIRAALTRTGGHRGRTAAELGLTRQGLGKLLSRLGLTDGDGPRAPDGSRPGRAPAL